MANSKQWGITRTEAGLHHQRGNLAAYASPVASRHWLNRSETIGRRNKYPAGIEARSEGPKFCQPMYICKALVRVFEHAT